MLFHLGAMGVAQQIRTQAPQKYFPEQKNRHEQLYYTDKTGCMYTPLLLRLVDLVDDVDIYISIRCIV